MKIEEDNIFEPENIKKAAEEYEVMSASSDQFVAAVKEAVADGRVIIDADYGHLESDELQEEIEKVLQPGNFFPCPPEMTQKLIEGIGVVGSTLTAKVADCQDPWIYFGRLLSHISCWKCGTRLHWKYDGKHLKLLSWKSHPEISDIIESDAPCPFAKGLTPIVVNLPVPSGKLVIGNDLRYLFTEEMIWGPKGSSDRFRSENSINHYAGKVRYAERYAQHGMLTGYVGEGAVLVYQAPDEILITKYHDYDPDNLNFKIRLFDGIPYSYLGVISLGLWWYGAADFLRCQELNSQELAKTTVVEKPFYLIGHQNVVLDVKPGQYQMTHTYDEFNTNSSEIFSRITRIGD